MFDEQGSPRMYANILMSTDGSDVARKGVKHGIALAKALNAKATVITVTEPLPVAFGSGGFPRQEQFNRFDAACKESAGKVLDEARAMARDICRTVACSECAPSHCDYRNSKVQRLRLNRHGLSWASRPQEAIVGESNIAGPSGRKRAGVGSVVADTNDSAGCGETGSHRSRRHSSQRKPNASPNRPICGGCALDFASKPDVRFGSLADMCSAKGHVRFTPESDINCDIMGMSALGQKRTYSL